MYKTHVPNYIRFQASEGSVTELISTSDLQEKMCDLHRIAVQTHHISDNYTVDVTTNYNYNQIKVSIEENAQLVALEKNLDVCVLEARMDDNDRSTNPKNENNSFATTQKGSEEQTDPSKNTGDLCGRYGDISQGDYKAKIKAEKDRLKAEAPWLDFPMVDMQDEFGPHWNRKDTTCKSNSFAYKDAAHYNLNHARFSFQTFSRKMDAKMRAPTSNDFERAFFETVFPEGNFDKYKKLQEKIQRGYEASMSKAVAKKKSIPEAFKQLRGPVMAIYDNEQLRKAFTEQWKRNQKDTPTLKDLIFKEPIATPPITVAFETKNVVSTYGTRSVTEKLKIDTRLLNHPEHFKKLDVPPFFIGTVLRPGMCDYHCVYFEHFNAMGQLTTLGKSWATILIVRPGQVDEYIKRYASPHTYFIQLPERTKLNYLMWLSNPQGFSAGDSKFYCFRMAQYLHGKWGTPKGRRRCIIGDDQIFPFVHQIPQFNAKKRGGESEAEKEERLQALRQGRGKITGSGELFPDNDQYQFRNTIFDMEEESMMAPGNSRFVITHAAAFMYLDRVCTITKAGIVCLNNGPPIESWNVPLKKSPSAMCIWMMDLDVIEAGIFKEPRLQSILNPAYQAAEDLLQFRIARDRDIRVVSCSTVRWRKAATANCSTAGRSDASVDIPKPFRPIIKYHDMTRAIRWFSSKFHGNKFPTVYEWSGEWPERSDVKQIDTKCWPFERYAYSYRKLDKAFSAPEFWIEVRVGSETKRAYCVMPETMDIQWGGVAKAIRGRVTKGDLRESDIKYDGTYSAKHRMTVAILTMLNRTLEGTLEPYDHQKAHQDLDWARNKLGTKRPTGKKKPRKKTSEPEPEPELSSEDEEDEEDEEVDYKDDDESINLVSPSQMKPGYVYSDKGGDRLYYLTEKQEIVQYGVKENRIDMFKKGRNNFNTKHWYDGVHDYIDSNDNQPLSELGKFYITENDDTIDKIADMFYTDVNQIVKLNSHIPDINKTKGRTTFWKGQYVIY